MKSANKRVFSGAKWLVLVNIFQRVASFALNQALLLWTTPEIFGLAAVSLELLLSTFLFLSREGIRLSSLRDPVTDASQRQRLINLSWIPSAILGTVLSVLLTSRTAISNYFAVFQSYNHTVICLYCLGALLESIGEPWFNVFQNIGELGPRVRADAVAIFVRSVVTFLCVAYYQLGAVGFGIAQVTYGLTYFITLAWVANYTPIDGRLYGFVEFLPRAVVLSSSAATSTTDTGIDTDTTTEKIRTTHSSNSNELLDSVTYFDAHAVAVAVTATFSSFLKHMLTEADKIALTLTASTYNQGIFAITNNYGSLAARLLFLPIEESSRIVFAQILSELRDLCSKHKDRRREDEDRNTNKDTSSSTSSDNNNKENVKSKTADGTSRTSEEQEHLKRAVECLLRLETIFVQLLRTVSALGILFSVFGPNYSRVAVKLFFGRQWQGEETVRTLSAVCINVMVLAVNGISEAFVHAVAPPSTFRRINIGFAVSSLVFIVLAGPLVASLGTSGLVYAGSASMIVRIICSGLIIRKCFIDPTRALELPIDFDIQEVAVRRQEGGKVSNRDNDNNRRGEHASGGGGSVRGRTIYDILPSWWVINALVVALAVTIGSSYRYARSAMTLIDAATHIGVGAVAFIGVCFSFFTDLSKEERASLLGSFQGRNVG